MAMNIAGEKGVDYKRGENFKVDPFILVVDEKQRGRKFPPSEEEVINRAVSMMDDKQQQPIVCRRLPDKRLQVVSGYTRTAAGKLIRKGFRDHDGNQRQDEAFMLTVEVREMNDTEALVSNIIENAQRTDNSPIDDAHNHRRMREELGYTDAQIARKYGYNDQTKISRLRPLLSFPDHIQLMIHSREMPVSAALQLVNLPQEKWAEAIQEATKGNGKVNATALSTIVREESFKESDFSGEDRTPTTPTETNGTTTETATTTEPTPAAPSKGKGGKEKGKKTPLSFSEIRKFFESLDDEDNDALAGFGSNFQRWVTGQLSTNYIKQYLRKVFPVTKEAKEEKEEK